MSIFIDPSQDVGKDYCRISVGGRFFIYDCITNEILQVPRTLYDIFPSWRDGEPLKDVTLQSKLNRAVLKGQFGKSPPVLKNPLFGPGQAALKDISNITLCTTEKCNLRCAYCSYDKRYNSKKIMSFDIARQAVNLISPDQGDGPGIGFYGGEPLLAFSLVRKVVAYAKKRFPSHPLHFNMTTNGTIINREMAAFLIENNFSLLFSLDGPEKIHNRYRVYKNGNGTYRHVIKALLLFKQLSKDFFRSKVRINVVLAPPIDALALNEFFASRLPVPITRCSFSLVDSTDITFLDAVPYNDDDYAALEELRVAAENSLISGDLKANPLSVSLFSKPFRKIAHRNNKNISECSFVPAGQCKPGKNKIYIDVDGKLHICERVGEGNPIGSVSDGIDRKLVHKVIGRFFKDSVELCSGCFAKRMCGMCISRTLDQGRYNKAKRAEECEKACRFLARNLRSYLRIVVENPRAFENTSGFIPQKSFSPELREPQAHLKFS